MMRKIRFTIFLLVFLLVAVLYVPGCIRGDFGVVPPGPKTEEQAEEEGQSLDSKLSDLKAKIVTPPVVLSHTSGEEVYGSGDKELIFIKGSAEIGTTIKIYVNGILQQSGILVDSRGGFETINGVELLEDKNIIELIAVNSSGNESDPTKFNIFLIVPQKVEYILFEDSVGMEEIENIYYSKDNDPTIFLRGNYLPTADLFVQVNDQIVGEIMSDAEGVFSMDEIRVKEGSNEIAVWAITADGFVSAPVFSELLVVKDLINPSPSTLSGYQEAGANNLSWQASVDDNLDSYKIVRVEDPCLNPEYPENDVIVTFTDVLKTSYIDEDVEEGRAYFYTVWTLDKAGHAVSSNVVALPKPVYGLTIEKLLPFGDDSIGRREWYYQYYELTNTSNTTVDIQPMMVWLRLDPEPDVDMEISPLWEVHIWNPDDSGEYYYSNESIFETYIANWATARGVTATETVTSYSSDGLTKTVTVTETTRKAEKGDVNLKRIMTVTTQTTITATDLITGIDNVTTTSDSSSQIVGPELAGTVIEGLDPGEKVKIGIKVQNISADDDEEIMVHFQFSVVDCDGYYFIDEIVSTGDLTIVSSGKN